MEENIVQKKKILGLSKLSFLGILVLILLLIGALGTSYYFYQKSKSVEAKNPEAELQDVIRMVGKHIVLPTNETPTMATVSDPQKLKDQPFFVNAKKGDKVLIYGDSQKAILYSPSTDRIIEVAPINTTRGIPNTN